MRTASAPWETKVECGPESRACMGDAVDAMVAPEER